MTITINPEDDQDEIARKIGSSVGDEELRSSDSRRLRLQKGSQRRTREWGLTLDLDPEHETAQVDQSGEGYPEVTVTARKLPQPVTSLDPSDWDYAAQRALSWHEDGHILYTDNDDKMERLKNIDKGDKNTAHSLWNCLEDAAIELQLGGQWANAYPVLRALRANIFRDMVDSDDGPGIHDVERGGQVFPVAMATHGVLMDQWMQEVYEIETGVEEKLLDQDDDEYHFATGDDRALFVNNIMPEIETVIPDVLSEPDAVARNARIFEFIEAVLPDIDAAKGDGKTQMPGQGDGSLDGMPNDSHDSAAGEAQRDADALGDVDPDDIDEEGTSISPGDGQGEPVPIEDVDLDASEVARIAEEVSTDRIEEAGMSGDLLDEIEEMADAASGDELQSDSIVLPDERWDANRTTFEAARRGSVPIARILRNRLQQEKTSEIERNQRRGRFTGRGSSLVRATRGETEVKERVSEPEEKDYHFTFVLDRSGSMGGTTIDEAEKALGMLALALEDVGVEVSIIELYSNKARLAKPFGTTIERQKERVFHGQTSGGTPISQALELARARLIQEGENSYMVVVTDGRPADQDRFEKTIKSSPLPVIGVNLGSEGAGLDDYDRSIAAKSGADLRASLMGLVQQVMF